MSDGVFPDNIKDGLRWLLGGVFVFVAGFEGYVMLFDGRIGAGSISIAIAVALTVIVVWWNRIIQWRPALGPKMELLVGDFRTWAATLLICLLAIVFSPFVEEKRWPLSAWFSPPAPPQSLPSDVQTINDLRSQLEAAKRERDAATQQRDAAIQQRDSINQQLAKGNPPVPQQAPSPLQPVQLSKEEISSRIDTWRSIISQLNHISLLIKDGYKLTGGWADGIRENRQQFVQNIANFKIMWHDSMYAFWDMPLLDPGSKDIFASINPNILNNVYLSLTRMLDVVSALPRQLPDDYEDAIRPYANAVKHDLDTDRDWITSTQKTAASKSAELSSMAPQ
jgi:hypothetical protein